MIPPEKEGKWTFSPVKLTLAEEGELHPFNTRKHASVFYTAGRHPTPLPQHCWELFHTQDLTWGLWLMKSATKIGLASTVKTDPLPHHQKGPSRCCWIGAWGIGNANANTGEAICIPCRCSMSSATAWCLGKGRHCEQSGRHLCLPCVSSITD